MTFEELNKLQFKFDIHLDLGRKYVTKYTSLHPKYKIQITSQTSYRRGEPRRTVVWYEYNGKKYKTQQALLDAINGVTSMTVTRAIEILRNVQTELIEKVHGTSDDEIYEAIDVAIGRMCILGCCNRIPPVAEYDFRGEK